MPEASLSGPKVLVLLATFNGSRWIAEQLTSILRQNGVELHVVASDDGSADDTRAQLARFTADANVTVISRAAPEGSAAQNFFSMMRANVAEGFDFIAFADQDDVWGEDKLVRACEALRARGADGYSSAVTAVWSDGHRKVLRQVSSPTASDFLFEGAGQGCTFVISAAFYRRFRTFIIEHPELTQPLRYHDWAIYALARVWGLRWVFDPKPSMLYRQHEGNHTGARHGIAGIAKRLSLIKKGWYREQLIGIAVLCLAAAPSSSVVARWHAIVTSPHSVAKRLDAARFCAAGGRRRASDRTILLLAALFGWI